MLGFLHKTHLPHAHPHITDFFPSRPGTKIWDITGLRTQRLQHPDLYCRSLFHLVQVYNALPRHVVKCKTVSTFQHELTSIARSKCSQHYENRQTFLSVRHFQGTLLIWSAQLHNLMHLSKVSRPHLSMHAHVQILYPCIRFASFSCNARQSISFSIFLRSLEHYYCFTAISFWRLLLASACIFVVAWSDVSYIVSQHSSVFSPALSYSIQAELQHSD